MVMMTLVAHMIEANVMNHATDQIQTAMMTLVVHVMEANMMTAMGQLSAAMVDTKISQTEAMGLVENQPWEALQVNAANQPWEALQALMMI
ncbi:hypothetical protein Poli38472_014423 [Pythium oligandrum]|uniref:Uncharacterized protein n=1 Tax=Pythium oligandrum TaxID=41045 RepID=A0A8K1C7E2_PYTOL|nr:hypothetical protein Poli38472_014423 [Pythium oligandrum]|eukprot:TMW57820.1 hypothetical protein Poli38472_014423 [Pythium oligandrum]